MKFMNIVAKGKTSTPNTNSVRNLLLFSPSCSPTVFQEGRYSCLKEAPVFWYTVSRIPLGHGMP